MQRGDLASEGFVKVKMSSPDGTVETLWAVRVAPGRFRLDNLPFFAYGVSLGDIVEGTEYAPNMYELVGVVEPSGNRLVRVVLEADAKADTAAGRQVVERLQALGCDLENMNQVVLAVSVPPDVDLAAVTDYVTGAGLQWEYANPTYEKRSG